MVSFVFRSCRRRWPAAFLLVAACGGEELQVCPDGSGDFATIGEAVAAARPGTGIAVCAGTYAETLVIDRSLRLRGDGADITVIDAGGAATAITIATGADVTVAGFTIRNGDGELGGAVQCVGGAVTVRDSVLTANQASRGGAVYAEACSGQVVDSRIVGNTAGDGGGLTIVDCDLAVRRTELRDNVASTHGGAIYLSSDSVVEDSTIAGNQSGWTGGGIYVAEHAPTVRGTTITGCSAVEEGGGMYLHQSHALLEDNVIEANTADDDGGGIRLFESEARLVRNRVAGNHAGGDGGGIKSSHLPSELVDNEIVENEAPGAGGGLELDNDSSVVRGGTIARNHGGRGGGVHVMLAPWEGALIEDVEIVDNEGWRGGGLYVEDDYQPVTLRRLTIARNTAAQGGGVYASGGYLVLSNSLIAANQANHEGGGLYLAASEPWDHDCPCPPADPPTAIDFLVVHGNLAGAGAALWLGAPNVSFDSSILSGHAGTAVTVADRATPAWRYNDTQPAAFSGMNDPTGRDGNLSIEPSFTAAEGGDFRLLQTSACIDAGDPAFLDRDGSRADMGLFAGPEAP